MFVRASGYVFPGALADAVLEPVSHIVCRAGFVGIVWLDPGDVRAWRTTVGAAPSTVGF